jgi:hypothetical protein
MGARITDKVFQYRFRAKSSGHELTVNSKTEKQPAEPPEEHTSATDLALVHGQQPIIGWDQPDLSNISDASAEALLIFDYENPMQISFSPNGVRSPRTRSSSYVSIIEPWERPTSWESSATSTTGYTFTLKDTYFTPSTLPYTTASYPMTGMPMSAVNPMFEYGHFGPRSLAQRDDEEKAFLFPEESFGMGNPYKMEEYLENYWKYFHLQFPIIHKPTFVIDNSPLLHAAMLAIGGQYSGDPSVRRHSRILHDRGMKTLDKVALLSESKKRCSN